MNITEFREKYPTKMEKEEAARLMTDFPVAKKSEGQTKLRAKRTNP